MPDYIKANSKNFYTKNYKNIYKKKNCVNTKNCSCTKFQSYDAATFGQNVKICTPISCLVQLNCNNDNYRFQQYVNNQQNLYARMRRFPEQFPIISWVKDMNLNIYEQRAYSNMFYRRLGTSQSLPVNDDWGGFALTGSETPYTN